MQERQTGFVEIYQDFNPSKAGEQAGRCLSYGNPYCEWKCPVHNFIPNWPALIAEGKILASACGRFAHQTSHLKIFAGGDMVRGLRPRRHRHL